MIRLVTVEDAHLIHKIILSVFGEYKYLSNPLPLIFKSTI